MKKDYSKFLDEFKISTNNTLLVPSFQTTSRIFSRHLDILKDLNHEITLFKKSYED